jgi:protein-disulfide isomerase
MGAAIAVLLAVVAGTLFYRSGAEASAQQAAAKNRELLAGADAPATGSAEAKVHIVEFLDPACGTCAAFYPQVKKLMADNPGRIRLTVRHLPFHKGSEHVVRMLEAARAQGKYWQALEAVLASQDRWTMNHQAYPERVWPELAGTGLDPDRLRSEMNSPAIAARMERDFADARALGVTQTPEYFVNGRPLPSFGLDELRALVKDELRAAYP